MLAPFEPPYMQRAVLVMLLLAVLGGCCGVHVVLRRLAFSADVMSHTVFPGVVLAFVWDQSVFLGALVFGLLTAVLLTPLGRLPRLGEDAAMAILLTSLFALGVVVVSKRQTYTADLTAFLFGRVLTIDAGDVVLVAVCTALVVAVLVALHKELLLRAFDVDASAALGYRVGLLDLTLHVLVAVSVVAALKAVGTALAVALVVTPAAAARLVTDTVAGAMVAATAIGAAAGVAGLWVSYEASVRYDVRLAAGPAIVSLLTVAFAIAAGLAHLRARRAPAAHEDDGAIDLRARRLRRPETVA